MGFDLDRTEMAERATAGKPAKIILTADQKNIKADGKDLSFIKVMIVDSEGNLVPDANNLVKFTATGEGTVIATDNGSETSMESFQAKEHKAFNGLCLAVIQSKEKQGSIKLTAEAEGLAMPTPASIRLADPWSETSRYVLLPAPVIGLGLCAARRIGSNTWKP